MFMIVYTYTVCYLCRYVYKAIKQAVHLIISKECSMVTPRYFAEETCYSWCFLRY